ASPLMLPRTCRWLLGEAAPRLMPTRFCRSVTPTSPSLVSSVRWLETSYSTVERTPEDTANSTLAAAPPPVTSSVSSGVLLATCSQDEGASVPMPTWPLLVIATRLDAVVEPCTRRPTPLG